jgi:hypothetical protein
MEHVTHATVGEYRWHHSAVARALCNNNLTKDQAINILLDMHEEQTHRLILARMNERPLYVFGDGEREHLPAVFAEIVIERQRQVGEKGYTTAHDDEHTGGEIARAAAVYAMMAGGTARAVAGKLWPWDDPSLKDHTPRNCLIVAGALILAELERFDRAEAKAEDKRRERA